MLKALTMRTLFTEGDRLCYAIRSKSTKKDSEAVMMRPKFLAILAICITRTLMNQISQLIIKM